MPLPLKGAKGVQTTREITAVEAAMESEKIELSIQQIDPAVTVRLVEVAGFVDIVGSVVVVVEA
jgi:hypothetical protein